MGTSLTLSLIHLTGHSVSFPRYLDLILRSKQIELWNTKIVETDKKVPS